MVLQRVRETLTLILIGVLPFHAFLVTLGTKLLLGPGHAPLPFLALWKEVLLGLILLLSVVEVVRTMRWAVDILDLLIVGLLGLSVLLFPTTYHLPPTTYLYGFKYTLFPLLLFLILRRVRWSEGATGKIPKIILLSGMITATYGILTLLLPQQFFEFLGYSAAHSLYFPDAPLAAFQHIDRWGWPRAQSTFSGPNQFGLWLLIPLSVVVSMALQKPGRMKDLSTCILHTAYFMLLSTALFLTFSRAAWIAICVILGAILYRQRHAAWARHIGTFVLVVGCSTLVLGLLLFPQALLRPGSTRAHFDRPLEALAVIASHPLGLGLGTAGPATNRLRDACVYLRPEDDPSWAKGTPKLCVFLGDRQVQPEDRICNCPFLPENWYLQVGVELGVLGFLFFVALVLFLLWHLLQTTNYKLQTSLVSPLLAQTTFLSLLGLSIAALFLHIFEDAAVAYTMWILTAASVGSRAPIQEVRGSG